MTDDQSRQAYLEVGLYRNGRLMAWQRRRLRRRLRDNMLAYGRS